MMRSTILLLVGLTAVYAAGLKSAHPVNNVPASPTPQYFGVPQPGSYVAVSSVPQATQYVAGVSGVPQTSQYVGVASVPQPAPYPGVASVPQPAPYPGVASVPQSAQYVGVSSAPQHSQYVAIPSVPQPQPQPAQYVAISSAPQPQPSQYVGVSSAAHRTAYATVPAAPQPAAYAAEPTAPQPTAYVAGVSPKFNSAPVHSSPVGPAAPKYAQPAQLKSGVADKDAQIVSEDREVNHDGSFDFGFKTENGISVQSRGYIKAAASPNEEPIQVIEGSYQYFDGLGNLRTISYIADENGYRALGDDIPQPHEAILKALAHRR